MRALTDTAVRNLQAEGSRREIPDAGCRGLYLVVQPSGAKTWAFRYRYAGRPKKLTLDTYPGLSLADARERADQARAALRDGRDPASDKRARRAELIASAGDTVESVVESFVSRYAKKNTREATWRETERILNKEVVGVWKKRPVREITRRDVIELLDGIVDRGAEIQANRVLAALRKMCNWAVEREILLTSPCAGLSAPSDERSRDRTLSDAELANVWRAADAEAYPFGRLIQLLVLTGQRRDEVARMTWDEVDFDHCLWTIPRDRAKNDVAHEVPLAPEAVRILAELPLIGSRRRGPVFTLNGKTAFNGFSRAKRRLDAALASSVKAMAPWTLHDLRRTAATGMARLGQPVHVVEAVLNHRSGTIRGVAAVYNRHDYAKEKRDALGAWAREVERIAYPERFSSNVIPLTGAAHAGI